MWERAVMVRSLLVFVSGLAALCCQAAEPIAYIPAKQFTPVASPFVEVLAEHHHRFDERMVRMQRIIIPLPGLLVLFGEGGCVTAMVNVDSTLPVDDTCIGKPGLPGRDEFLSAVNAIPASADLAAPSMIVFSPLYDVGATQAAFPDSKNHQRMAEDGARLRELVAELRERHPDRVILEVYVGL